MRETALILHFIGLAMGLGTSFAFMFLGIAAKKLEIPERAKFMGTALILTRMGHIGLTLLLLSGGYLMTPYLSNIGNMPLFITKLVLFVILGALVGILSSAGKKAVAGDTSKFLLMAKLGPFGLITGLLIVVMAVLTFH